MQSEKRHLLDYAKPSNSTPSPALLPGRSQVREDEFLYEPHHSSSAVYNPQVVVTRLGHSQRRGAYIPPNAINSVSPLNVSEKRHPLGYPKPPSPTLPQGRSQTRAGGFPSVQETSGMAFTERAATGPRRSFELPEVLPLQSATTTSTDRGAQADQEEFRAASPKDAMPEPDPTAAADVPLRFIRATGAGGCYTSGSFTA